MNTTKSRLGQFFSSEWIMMYGVQLELKWLFWLCDINQVEIGGEILEVISKDTQSRGCIVKRCPEMVVSTFPLEWKGETNRLGEVPKKFKWDKSWDYVLVGDISVSELKRLTTKQKEKWKILI